MFILQEAQTPQGATCNAHRIDKLVVGADNGASVTLNSYANDTSPMIVWQDAYDVPTGILGEGNYPQNVYDYLVGANGPFSGATLMLDVDDLTKARLTAKQSVNTLRDRHIAGGIETANGIVDSDPTSLRNIMAAYQSAVLAKLTSSAFSVDWRFADNSSVTLDADAVIGMGKNALRHTEVCYSNSWSLKASIDAATNIAGVSAVDLTTGWPIL